MNKEEANKIISDNLEKMKKLFEESKALAKEHELSLRLSLPGVEDAGFSINFDINDSWKWERYLEKLDERFEKGNITEDEKKRLIEEKRSMFKGHIRWHSSSLNCADSYDDEDIFHD